MKQPNLVNATKDAPQPWVVKGQRRYGLLYQPRSPDRLQGEDEQSHPELKSQDRWEGKMGILWWTI